MLECWTRWITKLISFFFLFSIRDECNVDLFRVLDRYGKKSPVISIPTVSFLETIRTEDEERSKRPLRLVIAVCQMNGIALFSPLWLGFSSNFVAAGLLMELWEQTLRQPILRILCYYQPSNIHYQHSTENKKMYINKNISNDRNNSNFNVPFLRRSRRRADKWKLIVGKKNTARIIVTTKRVSREMNAREPAHPHPRFWDEDVADLEISLEVTERPCASSTLAARRWRPRGSKWTVDVVSPRHRSS